VRTDTLPRRLGTFAGFGLLEGILCALAILARMLFLGNRVLPRIGLTPLGLAGTYLAAGVVGGALFGLLYPLRRWFLGGVCLGIVALLPVYVAIALLMPTEFSVSVGLIIGGVLAFIVGGGVGAQTWSEGRARVARRTLRLLWAVTVACQLLGWYLGLRWAGRPAATVGLFLLIVPLYLALLATFARERRPHTSRRLTRA
jgi:hypothetical protein